VANVHESRLLTSLPTLSTMDCTQHVLNLQENPKIRAE
jgi:hypothetical protein